MLSKKLTDKFVVTGELTPPKGTNLDDLLAKAELMRRCVDAFNVTDSHAAHMSLAPAAAAHRLIDHGFEPILQMVTRDRNRIALQSDMLGAHVLGIRNLVCMGGDPPGVGDHADAKPVFDLSTSQLIGAANALNEGHDIEGNALNAPTEFHIGAVVNPGADNLDVEIGRMQEKVDAGARFFQTQAVYDVSAFAAFVDKVAHMNVAILAGIMPIRSVKMARYANDNIPGIRIPDAMIQEIAKADDVAETSIALAAGIVKELKTVCAGVHLMMLGAEDRVPRVLEAAEL